MRLIFLLCHLLIFLVYIDNLNAQDTYNFKSGDEALIKLLTKETMQELQKKSDSLKTRNAVIFCGVSVDSAGVVSRITTWNYPNDVFAEMALKAVAKTKDNWITTGKCYKLVIPFYFINTTNVAGKEDYAAKTSILLGSFFPYDDSAFSGIVILVKPIILLSWGPRY